MRLIKNASLGKGLEQTFLKDDVSIANKHVKRCSTTLTIKEMLIKTIVRYHATLIRVATLKKNRNQVLSRMWGDWNLCVSGNVKWYSYYGNSTVVVPEIIKNRITV